MLILTCIQLDRRQFLLLMVLELIQLFQQMLVLVQEQPQLRLLVLLCFNRLLLLTYVIVILGVHLQLDLHIQ